MLGYEHKREPSQYLSVESQQRKKKCMKYIQS